MSAEKKDKRRPTTLHPVRWKNTGFSDSVEHSSSSMGVLWMNWLPNPTYKVECLINGNFQKKYSRPAPSESCIFKAVSLGGHGSATFKMSLESLLESTLESCRKKQTAKPSRSSNFIYIFFTLNTLTLSSAPLIDQILL